MLKEIAKLPHEYNTWIGTGHTIPNGEEEIPYSDNTKFTGVIVLPPVGMNKEFWNCEINKDKNVSFYGLVPLYKEEMKYKLDHGLDALLDKCEKYDVSFVVDVNRKNTCKNKFKLW